MHKVLKAAFLPLPTTKSSFLIRYKELGILAEKRMGFKPNPPRPHPEEKACWWEEETSRKAKLLGEIQVLETQGCDRMHPRQNAQPCSAAQDCGWQGFGSGRGSSNFAWLHLYPPELHVQARSWPGGGTGRTPKQPGIWVMSGRTGLHQQVERQLPALAEEGLQGR